jgi:hypothetical protein
VTIPTILLVLALACFVLAAFGASAGRVSLTPLGLAFLTAAMLAGNL